METPIRLAAAFTAVAPHADAAVWLPALLTPMRSSGITTRGRVAAFLGQCAAESGGFTVLEEALSYRASRLVEVWPNRFPTLVEAAPYSANPQRLANHVYADRRDLGNGDEASGDGWKFRGGGIIQLTGRSNYAAFAHAIGMDIDDAADFARTPVGAVRAACWFWTRSNLNGLADEWNLRTITERINGGLTNFQRRLELCTAALAAIDGLRHPPAPPAADPDRSADALNEAVLHGLPTQGTQT